MGSDLLPDRPPLLFVLSGPSGVGKDALIRELRRSFVDVHYAITTTTRPPRPGETPGKDYQFVSKEEYDHLLDCGRLLAPARVHGHWYGAPVDTIGRALRQGQDVLLKIDVQGAIQLRRRIPQAVFIFLAPPSIDDLITRLAARHTESPAELERRIRDARFEMSQMPQYDYVVVNRDENLHGAVGQTGCILTAERLRLHRQPINLGSVDTGKTGTYTRLNDS